MLSSHLFQLFLTAGAGAVLYMVAALISALAFVKFKRPGARLPDLFEDAESFQTSIFPIWFFRLLVLYITVLLSISFIFDVGEVYQYSTYYKRAFANLEDDIPIIISILAVVFLLSGSQFFLSLTLIASALAGGKMAIIALFLGLIAAIVLSPGRRRQLALMCAKGVGVALIGYFLAISVSNGLSKERDGENFRSGVVSFLQHQNVGLKDARKIRRGKSVLRGHGSCKTSKTCFDRHIKGAVFNRFVSSVGGFWMTLQGGYPGNRYPNTPEKFADLMVEANPFGINDRFDLSRKDWLKSPPPQNAYARFGAGYGYWGLGLLLVFVSAIALMAISNVRNGETGPPLSLTIGFFLITAVDQTQPWTVAPSRIMVGLGLCTTHIVVLYLLRRRIK